MRNAAYGFSTVTGALPVGGLAETSCANARLENRRVQASRAEVIFGKVVNLITF
jgi:hypothetical protein